MERDVTPPVPKWQPSVTSVFLWHQQQERHSELEWELAKTREELQAMQDLLEDLPKLFEDKFRQRLQQLLEQQQRLLRENAMLRQHLLMPQQEQSRPGRRQALLHAFGFGNNRAA
jgi:hypothetical protein